MAERDQLLMRHRRDCCRRLPLVARAVHHRTSSAARWSAQNLLLYRCSRLQPTVAAPFNHRYQVVLDAATPRYLKLNQVVEEFTLTSWRRPSPYLLC